MVKNRISEIETMILNILLADGTSINKVFDKGCQTWPPKVTFKDGLCAKDAMWPEEGEEWME